MITLSGFHCIIASTYNYQHFFELKYVLHLPSSNFHFSKHWRKANFSPNSPDNRLSRACIFKTKNNQFVSTSLRLNSFDLFFLIWNSFFNSVYLIFIKKNNQFYLDLKNTMSFCRLDDYSLLCIFSYLKHQDLGIVAQVSVNSPTLLPQQNPFLRTFLYYVLLEHIGRLQKVARANQNQKSMLRGRP